MRLIVLICLMSSFCSTLQFFQLTLVLEISLLQQPFIFFELFFKRKLFPVASAGRQRFPSTAVADQFSTATHLLETSGAASANKPSFSAAVVTDQMWIASKSFD